VTSDPSNYLEVLSDHGLLLADHHAVLLVGSHARGWANSRSDFDIYLVSAGRWDGDGCGSISIPLYPPTIQVESFYHAGRKWEIINWQDAQIEQILAKVSWDEFERGRLAAYPLSTREEQFLDRLATCVVLAGEEWVRGRRGQLDGSAFRSFVIARSLRYADDAVEDALGQLDAGQLDSAVISARNALGHAVDALLEQHGEYGSHSPKWRPLRFRAANPSALSFTDYWSLETMLDYDPDKPEKWINEVLTVCQDISMKVDL
jgi:hypothetical protein